MSAEQSADLLEIEIVLGRLDKECSQFSKKDRSRELLLIAWLVKVGEYREPLGSPHASILQAVQNYGAFWHRWSGTLECPHCKADLRDHAHGPPFKRQIGRVVNDRIEFWECPDCRLTWERGL